ncbi:hypothetical protein POPTR_002G160650v4 [Populus trichocarpa]|uniref:Uncharacterized protein n=1 Tax=Populus trichocarpa TaxID=3694 RepID=A0ACC0TFE5_POPTR|nr:ascorbate transporter, chloroplastic-like isoform X4 [Populus trichocarpa]KAI9399878.1 hypothetical protein POPTR_002G160650v4 [Populus trichocarpa]
MAIGGLISNRNFGSLIGSGGWIADTLVSRGLSITAVRKIMQSIGFLGPAFFLTQLSHVRTPAMAVLCMACSQGSDAFSQSGLYSNHQDIGPRYAVYWKNTAFDLLGYSSRFDEDLILQAVTIQEHALYIPCLSRKYRLKCYQSHLMHLQNMIKIEHKG